ncbi:hypothetical protein DEI81_12610 [Curtobacterium sp. MCBD17_013]|nr:hypothetical protein DEI81_12610 [Curtobacterium sp. MCBD17_013]
MARGPPRRRRPRPAPREPGVRGAHHGAVPPPRRPPIDLGGIHVRTVGARRAAHHPHVLGARRLRHLLDARRSRAVRHGIALRRIGLDPGPHGRRRGPPRRRPGARGHRCPAADGRVDPRPPARRCRVRRARRGRTRGPRPDVDARTRVGVARWVGGRRGGRPPRAPLQVRDGLVAPRHARDRDGARLAVDRGLEPRDRRALHGAVPRHAPGLCRPLPREHRGGRPRRPSRRRSGHRRRAGRQGRVSDTHLEIERTYDLAPEAELPDLIGVGGILRAERQEPFELDATYWDTERFDLVAAHVTVRRRTGGPDAGWHIKRAASDTVRHEQHFPLTEDTDTVPDAVLAALFAERRGRALRPVVRIRTERAVTRLLDEDGDQVAELADDHVSAFRLDPDAPTGPRTWREVEVEAVEGVDEQVAQTLFDGLDARFAERGAQPAAVSSKLARGLAGVDAPRLRTTDKPAKGSAARVLRKRVARLRSSLARREARLRSGDTADLRGLATTSLGLAAVLGAYRAAFADADLTDRAVAAAEMLADVVSRAASAEYLVGDLHRAGTPAQDALVDTLARERLLAATRERRDEAVRDTLRFLHTPEYLDLLDLLDDAVERPEPTAWALRTPKRVAQDVTAAEKPVVRELVRAAVGDDPADETGDREATERAWLATMRMRIAMDVLGDEAFPHALGRRITVAADVLTERAQSLHALEELRHVAGIATRAGEDTFGYGVLAGDRVRRAEESYDDAVQALSRV